MRATAYSIQPRVPPLCPAAKRVRDSDAAARTFLAALAPPHRLRLLSLVRLPLQPPFQPAVGLPW